jgi:hypothetical protein
MTTAITRAAKFWSATTIRRLWRMHSYYVDGCDVEVWKHERLVARLKYERPYPS